MTEEFNTIEEVANKIKIKSKTKENKIVGLFAFNSTGKTRLTGEFVGAEDDGTETLRYGAFLEDIFFWDNENYVLKFDINSWIIRIIVEQGLDGNIIDNFKNVIDSKIEPSFDFNSGSVTFNIASGDNNSLNAIKISRGEESVFIWSVFYSLLEAVVDTLGDKKEDRTTKVFNNLKYIVIDDPISSVDDTHIITTTVKLVEQIKKIKNCSIDILITTHHALFYNVIFNSFKRDKKFESFILVKENGIYKLSKQNDSPFSYHLFIKNEIKNAISNDNLEKYHYNMFRSLLEKTANFLGYEDWTKCLSNGKKEEIKRILQIYSHSKLAELESRKLSFEDKDIFIQEFQAFCENYFHEIK